MAGDNRCAGVRVRVLPRASCFYRAGLRPGDRVVAVNGEPVSDELEFRYHAASPSLTIEVMRHDRPRTMTVAREPGTLLEVGFHQPPVRRCANRCIFCFIDQMPPGLRTSLYVKDEDAHGRRQGRP
jgi:NifB/MoaA-like Fe-S oxidoreductase